MVKKMTVPMAGLHCKACEILTADALQEIDNVKQAEVSFKSQTAEIFYEGEKPNLNDIKKRLEAAGYGLDENVSDAKPKKGYTLSSIITLVSSILIILWGFNKLNLNLNGWLDRDFSWPLAVLVGLVAGMSTCLALIGGLIMGLAANYANNHPEASARQKFRPHLLFNAGRIGGFFLLGGVLGSVGKIFKLSVFVNSLITLLVGAVILILGLKLLNIFPALNKLDFSLPKKWSKVIKKDNPIILGVLTFFVPCGFTQAMQLYALSANGFLRGGAIMGLFALGTAPGLLGIGGLSSLLDRRKNLFFFKVAGVIIILFGLFNLNNGYKLFKISTYSNPSSRISADQDKKSDSASPDNVQIVEMTEGNNGYTPSSFTIIKGQPVRWVIKVDAPYSCATSLVVPSLRIQKQLKRGENVIEFTPDKTGNIPFSCSMGMYTGNFTVVEK